jgi:hypothetical protein
LLHSQAPKKSKTSRAFFPDRVHDQLWDPKWVVLSDHIAFYATLPISDRNFDFFRISRPFNLYILLNTRAFSMSDFFVPTGHSKLFLAQARSND